MPRCSASSGCFCCKVCQHVLGLSRLLFGLCGLFWDVSVVLGCIGCFGPPWDVLVVLGCLVLRSDVHRLFMLFSSCLRLFSLVFGSAKYTTWRRH